MTALKWLLIVVSAAYACGLAVLFFVRRSYRGGGDNLEINGLH